MAHPDLPAEQAYVDHAYECLDAMRQAMLRSRAAPAATDVGIAPRRSRPGRSGGSASYEDAESGLCFGRIDLDAADDSLYVGRRWVDDDDGVLVVNWQAPAARPFYTATPAEPHGVTLRRRFRLQRPNAHGHQRRGARRLARRRCANARRLPARGARARARRTHARHRRDDPGRPVRPDRASARAAARHPGWSRAPARPPSGLHRASYLLFAHRAELRRVLVVGPNPVFMDYVSHVLPALGEDAVDQRAVAELVEGADVTLVDPPDVERLKGDPRLAEVIRRAVELRSRGTTARARRADGRDVRRRARARGRRAARGGAFRARPLRGRSRALSDETSCGASTPTTERRSEGSRCARSTRSSAR